MVSTELISPRFVRSRGSPVKVRKKPIVTMARLAASNDISYGRLNLIDLETYGKSSRLAWLGIILLKESLPWKAHIKWLLNDSGGNFLLRCNCDVEDCNIDSSFSKELLQWWADFRAAFSTKSKISHNIIWNNKSIEVDKKTNYYPN